jgi:hypothetical protein
MKRPGRPVDCDRPGAANPACPAAGSASFGKPKTGQKRIADGRGHGRIAAPPGRPEEVADGLGPRTAYTWHA